MVVKVQRRFQSARGAIQRIAIRQASRRGQTGAQVIIRMAKNQLAVAALIKFDHRLPLTMEGLLPPRAQMRSAFSPQRRIAISAEQLSEDGKLRVLACAEANDCAAR